MSTKKNFVIWLALLCVAPPAWSQMGAFQWDFSEKTLVEFSPQGNITRISIGGYPVSETGRLFLHKGDRGGVIYQGGEFVTAKEVKWDRSDREIKVSGVLLAEERNPSAPGAAGFVITYKKLSERSLEIEAEITYLSDAAWDIPASFIFSFPVQDFIGAEFLTFDRYQMERGYEIGENEIVFDTSELSAASLKKDGQSLTIESGKETFMSVQDARSFGGDYLKVSLAARQPEWRPPFSFWAGMKQTFRARITFKGGR